MARQARGTRSGSGAVKPREAGNPCTIQDLYLDECLGAVRLAENCPSTEELAKRLASSLPQNSPYTRQTYSGRIVKWIFPLGIAGEPILRVWEAYRDEQILFDHFRVRYLQSIPILGAFVAHVLPRWRIGEVFGTQVVREFLESECSSVPPKTVERLPANLSKLGFLRRTGGGLMRTMPTYDPTSLLLEFHRVFAPSPATIPFVDIVADPFWEHLGVPDVMALEHALYTSVSQGLIAKFVKADELNQVTTRYRYSALLEKKARLVL